MDRDRQGSARRTEDQAEGSGYALPTTSGEFVVLYDAEDRPHPMQLQEAWLRFSTSDENLACLQAPLVIANGAQGWLSSMFAFEYAALFRGLLPFLSRGRLLFPLGGTSNHFRRAALEHVGGWDPYNVTEDADLGTRLRRFGYRCEMITHPTCEDGPTMTRDWISQRTRWFKGWMQTWLVHMRRPLVLLRDLGTGSFLVSQIVFAGMVVSALAHPILLGSAVFLLGELVLAGRVSLSKSVLIFLDSTNVILGYLAFLALGFQTLTMREKTGFWRIVALTPPYWLLMSLAAWRALYQVIVRPHEWEKTPHYPRRPVAPARSAADERVLPPNAGLSRLRDSPVPRR